MRIAILGAGFCGLACCWNILQKFPCTVDIFDSNGIGGEASKVAAGLLHKYSGAHAKLNRFAEEGEKASRSLIAIAEDALGQKVTLSKGILRIALTEAKKDEYLIRSKQYKDVKWLSAEECQDLIPGVPFFPGIFIEEGLSVDCQAYLHGIWLACKRKGAKLILDKIVDLQQLGGYDILIAAVGAHILSFPQFAHLKISLVKGQLLEFEWPSSLTPLPFSLNSEAYLTMSSDRQVCIAGSTFERSFLTPSADLEKAKELLLPKIAALYPPLNNAKIRTARAGIRVSTPDHLPIIGKFGKNLYAITGMGSKGLLYHALFAEKLCEMISMEAP